MAEIRTKWLRYVGNGLNIWEMAYICGNGLSMCKMTWICWEWPSYVGIVLIIFQIAQILLKQIKYV